MIYSQRCCSKLLVPQQFSDPTGTSKSQNLFTSDRTKQDYQLQRNINIGIATFDIINPYHHIRTIQISHWLDLSAQHSSILT